jgi:D-sedoheptulose 7-phosphate isomerase
MKNIASYISILQTCLDQLPAEAIRGVVDILHEARQQGRQVFIMGNGGSASTATHFVCDLAKNTREDGWPHFKVMGLSDNMALFSAYANDEGYDRVFVGQLANWIQADDVVIGISASGQSANVLRAIEFANQAGATTIAFTGFDGGALKPLSDICLHVRCDSIEQVEDIHLMLEHMITKTIREEIQEASAKPLSVEKPEGQVENATSEAPSGISSQMDAGLPVRIPSLEVLNGIGEQLTGELDLQKLLSRTLELTVTGVGAQSGSILVLDEKGDVIEARVSYAGEVISGGHTNLSQVVKGGLAGWVAKNRQPAWVADTSQDPRWLAGPFDVRARTRSAVSLPLLAGDRVVGVLTLVNPRERQFTEVDLAYLIAITVCVSLNSRGVLTRSGRTADIEASPQ